MGGGWAWQNGLPLPPFLHQAPPRPPEEGASPETQMGLGGRLPQRAAESRVHLGDGGVAAHVGDLQTPPLVPGEPQLGVDVDPFGPRLDGADVVAGRQAVG